MSNIFSRMRIIGISGILILCVLILSIPALIENLDAKEILVVQSVMGDLTVHTDPGPKWQGFGKITTYPRQRQYSFCSELGADGKEVQCQDTTSTAKRVR